MKDLKNYEDYYPKWFEYKQEELGLIEVEVANIIGGDSTGIKYYYEDWTPKPHEKTFRYENVNQYVKDRKRSAEREGKDCVDLGSIHLIKIEHEFYIGADGYRRVSNAKMMGIKRIMARVTELVINNLGVECGEKGN